MATVNLITKTLGSTNLQSGQGSPDHVASIGSIYTNTANGTVYVNADGTSTGWEQLMKQAHGEIYVATNATTTTTTLNAWTRPTNLTWVLGDTSGLTQTATSSLAVGTNRDGRYMVVATGTLQFNVATATYDIGVSKNNNSPDNGFFASTYLLQAGYQETVSVVGYVDLVATDTLQIVVRNSTNSNAFILRHASLTVTKIY